MTELHELGLVIRSDGVVVAKNRLRDFATEGKLVDSIMSRLTLGALRLASAYSTWRVAEAIIRTVVRATIESERAQKQLETVVKSTGMAAGYTANQLSDMATSLQRVTTYGDEAIKSAQAILLTFTRISRDVFPDVLEATLNVSTALNQDLKSSALQLGKAFNDPILGMSSLSRSGIQFTETQKQMVKQLVESNNMVGAQKIILKELETQFGNSARAARGTLGGALTALNEAFGDLFEANGPSSEKLRDAVERLAAVITSPNFIASVQNFGAALLDAFAHAMPYIERALQLVGWMMDQGTGVKPMNIQNWGTLKPGAGAGSVLFSNETLMKQHLTDLLRGGAIPETSLNGGQYPFGDMSGFFNDATKNLVASMNKPAPSYTPLGNGPTSDQIAELERQAKAYDKLILTSKQFVENQQLEATALGMTKEAAAAMRYEQELLNKAANDNIKLTPDMRAELEATADAMAAAEERTRRLTEAYDFGKSVFTSFFSDLKSELMNGTSLWSSFATAGVNALNKIADKALNMAAEGIFDLIFNAVTGSIGGGFGGSIVSSPFRFGGPSFDGGGYTGNGSRAGGLDGKGGYLAMVHPKEQITDLTKGGSANQNGPMKLEVNVIGANGGDDVEERAYRGAQRALDEYRRYGIHEDVEQHLNDRHAVG